MCNKFNIESIVNSHVRSSIYFFDHTASGLSIFIICIFSSSVESQKVGQEDREGESQSSKRSRSSGSDSDSGNQQVKKKARIVDSDSDDETPQAAAATGICMVFRINREFRISRLTFHRKSASKC